MFDRRASVWFRAVRIEGAEAFLEVQFIDRSESVLEQFQLPRVMKIGSSSC